ncbi:MAG: MFS transporter [Chloroflexota bacterium]
METAHKKSPRIFYGWWIVLAAASAFALNGGVFRYGLGAFFEPLLQEFKCSRVVLSGAFSLRSLETGLLGPIDGFLVDRFGSRRMALIGVIIAGSGFLILSRVPNIAAFYAAFLFLTVGIGLGFGTALMTAIGNWFDKKRGLAFGIAQSGLGIGGILVPVVSSIIVRQGWRFVAQGIGFLFLAIGIPIALTVRDSPERYGYLPDGENEAKSGAEVKAKAKDGFTTKEALSSPVFWLLAIVFALRFMVTGAVPVHIMPYLTDVGFSTERAAAALGSIAAVSTLGRMGFGWLGDRLPKRYVIAGLLTMLAASLLLLTRVRTFPQLIIYIAAYAPAYGGLATLTQAIRAEYFGRRSFGSIMGYMNLLSYLGTAAGPVFAAYVWEKTGSYRLAFIILAITTLMAMVMVLWAKPPARKRQEQN